MSSKWMVIALTLLVTAPCRLVGGGICDQAAQRAALDSGVPHPVMKAIARIETGRRVNGRTIPWSWSLNIGGEGRVFATRAEAAREIDHLLSQGIRNFDIGCFQINAFWHRDSIHHPIDLLDPEANARFAARLLIQHFTVTGDWTEAAGRFHSKTPAIAEAYKEKYLNALAALGSAAEPATVQKSNPYPFFRTVTDRGHGLGSLVPASSTLGLGALIGG